MLTDYVQIVINMREDYIKQVLKITLTLKKLKENIKQIELIRKELMEYVKIVAFAQINIIMGN